MNRSDFANGTPLISIRKHIFVLPLAYFLSTRLHGAVAVVSWVLIYPLPICLSVLLVSGALPAPAETAQILLAMLATYGVYELGYMDNDTRTVRNEAAPTERLSEDEKRWFLAYRPVLFSLRLAVVIVLIAVISLLAPEGVPLVFCVGTGVMAAAFIVYNSVRGTINIPLHLVLVTARFCLPGTVLYPDVGYVVALFFAFPFINTLERAGEYRYGLSPLVPLARQRDLFRVVYYLLASAAAWLCWSAGYTPLWPLFLFVYFLAVRGAGLLVALRVDDRLRL